MNTKINENYKNPVLTLDLDWAPDFIIENIARRISKKKIKATWFITHNSKAIKILKRNPLFELGIHPNFNINSTQGKDPDDILKKLKKIVPKAESVRTHGLLQSTGILLKFKKYEIKNDVSILLFKENLLKPHFSKYLEIFRFPYFWEDDIEMMENLDWKNVKWEKKVKGLKIFNFHPIHIYLNSQNMEKYYELREKCNIQDLEKKMVDGYINKNLGVGTFFDKFLENLDGKKTYTISELSKNINQKIKG